MKRICFVTGTRADYGIMAPVMQALKGNPEVELQIIATNMHLSPEFGMTVKEIEAAGFKVDAKISSLVSGGTAVSTVLSMAKTEEGLAEAFDKLRPDMVVILGDRYEALAAASAAVVFNIPVVHLHGGETTEGAIDDKFRHAITQLSDYHFAATPQYVERIISMGNDPSHVFHSGAPGAECRMSGNDSLKNNATESQEFFEKTGISAGEPFILLAFHPVTTLADRGEKELVEILEALNSIKDQKYKILVTKPNSDPGNQRISELLEKWASKTTLSSKYTPLKEREQDIVIVESLGSRLFHYAMENASAMVGNSSAALIEAPTHRLGAVNVGIRQKGRAHGPTVVDSPGDRNKISEALKNVLSLEMKAVLMGMPVQALNPYYKEDAAGFIAEKLITL